MELLPAGYWVWRRVEFARRELDKMMQLINSPVWNLNKIYNEMGYGNLAPEIYEEVKKIRKNKIINAIKTILMI